jgi:hypothetical protein
MLRRLLTVAALVAFAAPFAFADTAPSPAPDTPTQDVKAGGAKPAIVIPPEKKQPVRINKLDTPPAIDGQLTEDVWKQAAVFKDFYQISPGDNIAPSKSTEVMIGYDARFLYLAVRAADDPGQVRATVAKRDNIFGEDNIRFFIDTYNDQRKAYIIAFNPLGVQQDGIRTEGQNEDYSVDIVMESKGVITETGWTLEAAIPFKSLRYVAGKDKLWGLHIWRNIDRFNDEIDSWMPISRDVSGTLNQAGHITGLEGISTERTLELIPSLTVSQTGRRVRTLNSRRADAMRIIDQGRFVNQGIDLDPGLTAKWGITPTLTLDLALNPDFAQVEADALVNTANQRFPIFFEEKRPFFLEGIDIFRTMISAVHTRTIVDPDLAVKLTGRQGRTTFGVMYASDNAPGNLSDDNREFVAETDHTNDLSERDTRNQLLRFLDKNASVGVLRLKRDVGKENSIGFLATSYNFADRNNYLGGFDARFRLSKVTTAEFQVLGSNARRCELAADPAGDECRTHNGFAYAYSVTRAARHLWLNVNGAARTEGFRADVGFNRRLNTNNHNLNVEYNTEPKPKAKIVSWNTYHYFGGNFDWQGRLQNYTYEGQVGPSFQRQTFIRAGFNAGYERVFAREFGETVFAGGDDEHSARSKNFFAYGGSTPTKRINFFYFFGYRWGEHDFDFGAGPKFPRVSPSAIAARKADEDGLCSVENPPEVCAGLLQPGVGNYLYTNGEVTYKATDDLNMTLSFNKNRLVRNDSGRVAFDSNIFSLRSTYQFTRFWFARARIDYDTLNANARGQFLLGWTPNPGTSFYAGYNDDMNRNGFNPFTGQLEPGFRRNGRTFFIKMSYLFRRSL